ncbi:MAG: hypothetical protein CML99_14430 [Rhodobiaceae bacterium]|nr:hypothetical protein [Rhodobiaceae bacterium]
MTETTHIAKSETARRRAEKHMLPPGNRLSDLAGAALSRTTDLGLARFHGTRLYGFTLAGPMPDTIVFYPKELRPARVDKAMRFSRVAMTFPAGRSAPKVIPLLT